MYFRYPFDIVPPSLRLEILKDPQSGRREAPQWVSWRRCADDFGCEPVPEDPGFGFYGCAVAEVVRVGAAGEEQHGHSEVERAAVLGVGGVLAVGGVPEQGESILSLIFCVVPGVQEFPELEQVVLLDCLVSWRPLGRRSRSRCAL